MIIPEYSLDSSHQVIYKQAFTHYLRAMQNRQKDEMIRDILTVANGGAAITQIMFKAYTSHAQAKSYLGELIQNAFIEYDGLDRKYRTTSKGLEYLQAVDRMSEMLTVNTRRSVAGKQSTEAFQF